MTISFLQGTSLRSYTGVITPSRVPNMLPSPRVSNMQKNSTAHKGEAGILTMASVKAMKVRPGPWADYEGERDRERKKFSVFMCPASNLHAIIYQHVITQVQSVQAMRTYTTWILWDPNFFHRDFLSAPVLYFVWLLYNVFHTVRKHIHERRSPSLGFFHGQVEIYEQNQEHWCSRTQQ